MEIKFPKIYKVFEIVNQYNKKGELILWNHSNIILLTNKQTPFPSKYYIY